MVREVAVGVGFEPTEPLGSLVFKTRAFDHSATPPKQGSRRPAAVAHECEAEARTRAGEHTARPDQLERSLAAVRPQSLRR